MGRSEKGKAAEQATPEEVEAAVVALSPADLHRLEGFARIRAQSLRALGLGWSSDDLLQEALVRTFGGRRHWKRGITFVKHLIETMRSISSHVPDELHGRRPVAIKEDADENDRAAAILIQNTSGPGDFLGACEVLTAIRQHFANDEDVRDLIDGLTEEMTGPEIQEALGWSQTRYDTIMRKLRRKVRREEEWRP